MSSREEFEACWADVTRGDEPPPGNKPLRSKIDPDVYRGDAVNFAWKWWQRSRAQESDLLAALKAITNSGPDAIPIKEAFEMAHRAIERASGGKV